MNEAGPGVAGRLRGALALLVCMVALGACQVRTDVALTARPNGSGSVVVTVTVDRDADASIGGLASQLQVSDLAARGWQVGTPQPLAGGGEAITASRSFTTLSQASSILSSLAGPEGARSYRLTLTRSSTLWHTTTALHGVVDLTCDVACFGDSGLSAATGSPVGVDVAALARQSGVDPAEVLHFGVRATLPGSITSTDAVSRGVGGVLSWQPRLGGRLDVDAATRSWNSTHVAVALVAAAVLALALALALALLWRRRRRRRRRSLRAHGRGAGARTRGANA